MEVTKTTPEQKSNEELQHELEELQNEREWTRAQHRRWAEERGALIVKVQQLRDELAETKKASVELLEWSKWLNQQHDAWQKERELLVDAANRMSIAGRIRTLKRWLLHPLDTFSARNRK